MCHQDSDFLLEPENWDGYKIILGAPGVGPGNEPEAIAQYPQGSLGMAAGASGLLVTLHRFDFPQRLQTPAPDVPVGATKIEPYGGAPASGHRKPFLAPQ